MSGTGTVKEQVSVDADWKQRVKCEERTAKQFESDWSNLSGSQSLTDTHGQKAKAVSPVKYYGGEGGWIVKQKFLPNTETQDGPQMEEEAASSVERGPTGHLTARSSAMLSHTMRLGTLNETQGRFGTSSKVYGSRLPIEQFGVAQHGIHSSPITNGKGAS